MKNQLLFLSLLSVSVFSFAADGGSGGGRSVERVAAREAGGEERRPGYYPGYYIDKVESYFQSDAFRPRSFPGDGVGMVCLMNDSELVRTMEEEVRKLQSGQEDVMSDELSRRIIRAEDMMGGQPTEMFYCIYAARLERLAALEKALQGLLDSENEKYPSLDALPSNKAWILRTNAGRKIRPLPLKISFFEDDLMCELFFISEKKTL